MSVVNLSLTWGDNSGDICGAELQAVIESDVNNRLICPIFLIFVQYCFIINLMAQTGIGVYRVNTRFWHHITNSELRVFMIIWFNQFEVY